MDTTCDGILGLRVHLEQPRKGFRVAVDTVLLAASVQAGAGQSALDMGCGAGGAMLCLAARVPGIRIMGVEIQPELVEICRRNIERNGMQDRAQVIEGDLSHMRGPAPALLLEGAAASDSEQKYKYSAAFDHVFMNPPYHEAAKHDLSQNQSKLRANSEQVGELAHWLAFAAGALKQNGQLTMIHRADRLEDILAQAALAGVNGGEILRIFPRENEPPSRVILRLRKGDKAARARDGRNLVLHGKDNRYTEEAERILRHAEKL